MYCSFHSAGWADPNGLYIIYFWLKKCFDAENQKKKWIDTIMRSALKQCAVAGGERQILWRGSHGAVMSEDISEISDFLLAGSWEWAGATPGAADWFNWRPGSGSRVRDGPCSQLWGRAWNSHQNVKEEQLHCPFPEHFNIQQGLWCTQCPLQLLGKQLPQKFRGWHELMRCHMFIKTPRRAK